MKTVTFTAMFDGEHILIEDNPPLTKNARLLVTVLPDKFSDERAAWLKLSAQGLTRAYGESEPDYPDACLKSRNPSYEAG
jgi:hypothetical protein